MFVPEGYLPLIYVKIACAEIAQERFQFSGEGEEDLFLPSKPDPRFTLYIELLMNRFIDHFWEEFFVFQYPHTLLRAPKEVFFTDRIYDGPCPNNIESAEIGLQHIHSIDVKFISDEIRIETELKSEAAPLIQLYGLESFLEDAKPLQGAVLCWRSSARVDDLPEMLRRFRDEEYWSGLHPDFPLNDEVIKSDPRNDGLLNAYSCFQEKYPNGKVVAKVTWAEIERTVGYSRRTILRAIKKFGHNNVGNAPK